MIRNFKLVGEYLLERDGFFETHDEEEKRKILLQHQALKPYVKKDKNDDAILDGKAICLNFDLEKDCFDFRLSEQDLEERNKDWFFAFRLGAPKDKKKFLSTNSIDTFYSALFLNSIQYIDSKRKNKKSREWFKQNISASYDELFNLILDRFYIQDGKEFFLNNEKLRIDQKGTYLEIKEGQKAKPTELYSRLLNKLFFGLDSKNTTRFPGISTILINGQHILAYEQGKYMKDYINLCFYDLLERFFIEKSKPAKKCHVCDHTKDIISNMPFPMKFYGTTNALNFGNVHNKNAYKSFSICKICLHSVLTGMKHVEHYFSNYLFDMNYYLIPHAEKSVPLPVFNRINKIFKRQRQQYTDDIQIVKDALKTANKRTVVFDLFFYYSPVGSQQFDVLQYISNIDIRSLFIKLQLFDDMSEAYRLDRVGKYDNILTIQDLRFYLFPSVYSQSNQPDAKVFRKDLLGFLAYFLSDLPFSYSELISRFVEIFKKRNHQEKQDYLSAFKMNLFLNILFQLKKIKGGGSLNSGKYVSEVMKKEYQSFFDVHQAIYSDHAYRQGLFLLGTLISKIKSKQKGKASTFLKKLNFNGIPPRRIPDLLAQVKEYSQIYKIYEEPGIWGNVMDRLQGIQSSDMKPDEVLFYILSGISFDDYLRMKAHYDKQLEENSHA